MKKYQTFYFETCVFNKADLSAVLRYSFDRELYFEERLFFGGNGDFELRGDIDDEIIGNILFHIHMAFGVSYYKFFPTKNLEIHSGCLSEEDLGFWKKFYLNGLGEFFYTNNIDPRNLLNFEVKSNLKHPKKEFFLEEKYLVPIGGGKDSIVSIELLKQLGQQIDGVSFFQHDNILYDNTAKNAGIKRLLLQRKLSDNITQVIEDGAYNGHVPITGMIAFVLEMAGYLYNYKYKVLSNEKSANFGNTFCYDVEINHQWSKSLDFERDFGEYTRRNIGGEGKYFSLLRPFYEIQIAFLFSKYGKKYFESFSSCNANFKIFEKNKVLSKDENQKKYWCNSCPKCLFVYTILRPFLSEEEVLSIFGKELFDEKNLKETFQELLGISGIKPFECVGTNEEVIYAFYLVYKKISQKPLMIEMFEKEVLEKMDEVYFEELEKKLFTPDFESCLIPKNLQKQILSLVL